MASSIFLAKLIGPAMLVAVVSFLVYTRASRAMAQQFLRSAARL
jgi:hypothetical protein